MEKQWWVDDRGHFAPSFDRSLLTTTPTTTMMTMVMMTMIIETMVMKMIIDYNDDHVNNDDDGGESMDITQHSLVQR